MHSIRAATLGVSLLACGAVGGTAGSTPEGVLKAFYGACNAGKYSEAEGYLTAEVLEAFKGPRGVARGGLRGYCDTQTKKGTMDRLDNIKVETRGEGAQATFKIIYKDGSSKDDHESLIDKAGTWKIGT